MKFAHCLRIVFIIGKYAYIFRVGRGGEDEFSVGWILKGKNFPRRWNFPGSEISMGNFTMEICQNSCTEFLYSYGISIRNVLLSIY